ncbi:MAG: hypothetical protein FRX48_00591 [Lasallia pustulata]|uniref:Uncharacterized protein n=1 Tax=Lasallia pustulata TaxID=136370 RepID=A0A5M8Q2A1_9LECA|nr:MAG: hypothetical protein FRX48_00591 [Lasallia pustulata]
MCESVNSDTTRSPVPLTAAFDCADWVLFPEESEEVQRLLETDRPPSTMAWRCGPGNGSHPPTGPRRKLASVTTSSQISFSGKTCKIREKKTFEVAESRGAKFREMNGLETVVDRSKEEDPIPRTPRPQPLPTPDLSDIDQGAFWACCIDPRASKVDEKRHDGIESIQNQSFGDLTIDTKSTGTEEENR